MNNFIINNYRGAVLHMGAAAVANLEKYAPAGCPFNNYSLMDLLKDLIKMYCWKLENGRKYSIIEFLECTNDAHALAYKAAINAALEEVATC